MKNTELDTVIEEYPIAPYHKDYCDTCKKYLGATGYQDNREPEFTLCLSCSVLSIVERMALARREGGRRAIYERTYSISLRILRHRLVEFVNNALRKKGVCG